MNQELLCEIHKRINTLKEERLIIISGMVIAAIFLFLDIIIIASIYTGVPQ